MMNNRTLNALISVSTAVYFSLVPACESETDIEEHGSVFEDVIHQDEPLEDIVEEEQSEVESPRKAYEESLRDRARRYTSVKVAGMTVECIRPELSKHKSVTFEPLESLSEQEQIYGSVGRTAFRDGLRAAGAKLNKAFEVEQARCWADTHLPPFSSGTPSYESVAGPTYCSFVDKAVESLMKQHAWFSTSEFESRTGGGEVYEKAFSAGQRAAGEVVKRTILESEDELSLCRNGIGGWDARYYTERVFRSHPEIFGPMEE